MKNLMYFLIVLGLFGSITCTENTYLQPRKTRSPVNSTSVSNVKMKSGVSQRTFIPGQLTWDSSHSNWIADFAGGGMLTITGGGTGPNYPPATPTPVWSAQSSTIPYSTVTDLGGSTFTVTFNYAESNQGIIIVTMHVPGGQGFDEVDLAPPDFSPGEEITLFGMVVLDGGNYYAVATDYQVAGGTKTAITSYQNSCTGTITITKHFTTTNANLSLTHAWYSLDLGDNWLDFGPTICVQPTDQLIFKGSFADGNLTLADFAIYPGQGDPVLSAAGGVTSAQTLPTSPVTIPVNYTVLFAAKTITITKHASLAPGFTLQSAYYSLNNSTWTSFGTSISVAPSTPVYFKGTIGQPNGSMGDYDIKVASSSYAPLFGITATSQLVGPTAGIVLGGSYTVTYFATPTP